VICWTASAGDILSGFTGGRLRRTNRGVDC
jgi:hypothetical protein